MKTSIYGYDYDFVQQNGYFLTISGLNGVKLTNDIIVPLQKKMIQSNRIPHLLPIDFEEMDFNTRVHYNITNKRMLTPYLSEKQLSMNEYFSLILNIISTLEESKLYMLNDQQYVLNEDFIFIGRDISDVYMAYLPFINIKGKENILEDLKKLLINLAGEVQGLNGGAFKQILHYIKNPGFNLAGLKETLVKLKAELITHQPMFAESAAASSAGPHHDFIEKREEEGTYSPHKNPVHSKTDQQQQTTDEKKAPKKKKTKLAPLESRDRTVIILFGVLAVALIWKMYDVFPTPPILYTSTGLSLVVIVLIYVLMKVWRPGAKRIELAGEGETVQNKRQAVLELAADPAQAIPNYGYFPPVTENVNDRFHFQNVALVNKASDDTVMLGEDPHETELNIAGAKESHPYFEVMRNGTVEKVDITGDHFIIGRNADASQYVENAVGVSRVHIEFIRIEGAYGVKDLGSKNGTKLNDEQMVPYKIYAIKDRDVIQIGKIQYTFRLGF